MADNNMYSQPVEVKDYYDTIYRSTWGRRTAGVLTGATLFGACGAIGGVVAAFLPYLLHAAGIAGVIATGLPLTAAVASTAAIFAAATGFMGSIISSDVSANASSIAAGLSEKEKREKMQGLDGDNIRDAAPIKIPRMFNWKVGIVTGLLFAAFGALMAFNPITATAVVGTLGLQAGSNAAIAASAIVVGMFGSTISLNFPVVSNKINNFYYKLIKGEYFDKEAASGVSMQVSRQYDPTMDYVMDEPVSRNRSFASDAPRPRQDILNNHGKPVVAPEAIHGR